MHAHRLCMVITVIVCISVLIIAGTGRDTRATGTAQGWGPLASGTTANLVGVYGAASFTVALGSNGTLLAYDGFEWRHFTVPASSTLNGVWGDAVDDVFAAGDAGTILRFDGVRAQRAATATTANLRGIWGSSPSNVYAVGDNGTILRFDGIDWTRMPSGTSLGLRAVVAAASGDAYAVGDNGTALHFDGTTWRLENTPTISRLNSVWVQNGVAVAVGNGGTVLLRSDHGWEAMSTPTTANLHAVWGLSDSQVFAVGDNGTVLFFNGRTWAATESGTSGSLRGIYNGVLVGDHGTILQNPSLFEEAANLRITEIDPSTGRVEITNTGPAFTTGALAFGHGSNFAAPIPQGTRFDANEIEVFTVAGLNRKSSDLWLFRTMPFTDPNNVISGVKYGTAPAGGPTAVAVAAGLWPSDGSFAAVPGAGSSLAWDGFGGDPRDWYVDETPTFGIPDFTLPGVIPPSLAFPAGTQDFESVSLGDEVFAITDWNVERPQTPAGAFTVRAVSDVQGETRPREQSTRWLRIRDQDGKDVVNVAHSPSIVATEAIRGYRYSCWLNVEELATAGEARPAIMVQHEMNGDFTGAWGIEIAPDNLYLVVTPVGGEPARQALLDEKVVEGAWIALGIDVDLSGGVVVASVDGGTAATLPIALDERAAEGTFRLAYDGSGTGNTGTILLDDVSGEATPLAGPIFGTVTASAGADGIELRWGINGNPAVTGFNVYRRVDDGAETLLAGMLPADAQALTDNQVRPGRDYRYVVGAQLAGGTEIRSRAATARTRASAVAEFHSLRAAVSERMVELEWDVNVSEPIAGFRIYRKAATSALVVDLTADALLGEAARRFVDASATSGGDYYYSVAVVTGDGAREIRSSWSQAMVPQFPLEISRVAPNPFTASTTLDVSLDRPGWVTISVYDVLGRYVTRVANRRFGEGGHGIEWDGRDAGGRPVAAGLYFFKVETRGNVLTRKVVLVR